MKWILPVLWPLLVHGCHAKLVAISDKKIKNGRYTYYFDDAASCETMLFLGVGTGMRSDAYSEFATLAVAENPNMVVVTMDHNPGSIFNLDGPIKTNPTEYSDMLTQLFLGREEHVPFCGTNEPKILMAGHSAGGQAAIQAMEWLRLNPDVNKTIVGFLGLAPYDMTNCQKIYFPSLIWDSAKQSCGAVPKHAGSLAFNLAKGVNRAFFQLLTDDELLIDLKPRGPHCVYTDYGCPSWPKKLHWCNPEDMQWVKKSVAQSIKSFLAAVRSNKGFDEAAFANVLDGAPPGQLNITVSSRLVASTLQVEELYVVEL